MHLANWVQPYNVARVCAITQKVLQQHKRNRFETRKSSQRVRGESKARDIQIINSVWSSGNELLNGFFARYKTNTKRSLVEKRVSIFFLFRVSSSTACCDVRWEAFAVERHAVRNWKFPQCLVAPPKHTKQIENTYKTQWKATVIQLNLSNRLTHILALRFMRTLFPF